MSQEHMEKVLTGSGETVEDMTQASTNRALVATDFDPKHINMIVQEGALIGAGVAAILLQLAEPGVGQGVNVHSNFTYRVADRVRTTMTFVYCMSYGTPEERQTICDMVTRVHTNIHGTIDEGRNKGKPYNALDPELQLWVAATLYATAYETYARIWGRIEDEALNDKIYQEYSILACGLQVPPEMWPPTRKAFWEYWDKKVAELEVTQHAKEVSRDLLTLRTAPWYFRMLMPSIRVVTAELLPERIRQEYGVTSHPRLYKLHEVMVKAVYRPLPLWVRRYPATLYMKDMRKRLAARKKVFEKA